MDSAHRQSVDVGANVAPMWAQMQVERMRTHSGDGIVQDGTDGVPRRRAPSKARTQVEVVA